jgi:hypothetical protein
VGAPEGHSRAAAKDGTLATVEIRFSDLRLSQIATAALDDVVSDKPMGWTYCTVIPSGAHCTGGNIVADHVCASPIVIPANANWIDPDNSLGSSRSIDSIKIGTRGMSLRSCGRVAWFKSLGDRAFSSSIFYFSRSDACFSALAARSVAAFAVFAYVVLSSSSNCVYADSLTDTSASYSHSMATPTTTRTGQNSVIVSFNVERMTDNVIGYEFQYIPHTRETSLRYSPMGPIATTRDAVGITDLSQDMTDSSADRSIRKVHKEIEGVAADAITRDKNMVGILVLALISGLARLIFLGFKRTGNA